MTHPVVPRKRKKESSRHNRIAKQFPPLEVIVKPPTKTYNSEVIGPIADAAIKLILISRKRGCPTTSVP